MKIQRAALAALFLGVSAVAVHADVVAPTTPPDAPKFDAQGEPVFVNRSDIHDYQALPAYNEPDWVKAFEAAGKLPPLADRLPKEPLVYKTANEPDGTGVYGDVMRHVIGGRPEGWNFWAGQSYGWGGIDSGLVECLTRTGPLFEVNAADLQPMPNLAKGWDWSADGKTLTVHLIEGAKWSDGEPFTTADTEFYYNDVVNDENVTPLKGAAPATYPGALIINKRFANIPAGVPIFMYNWAEDNIMRERVFVPKDKQLAGAELFPNTLPGKPGDAGPITAN